MAQRQNSKTGDSITQRIPASVEPYAVTLVQQVQTTKNFELNSLFPDRSFKSTRPSRSATSEQRGMANTYTSGIRKIVRSSDFGRSRSLAFTQAVHRVPSSPNPNGLMTSGFENQRAFGRPLSQNLGHPFYRVPSSPSLSQTPNLGQPFCYVPSSPSLSQTPNLGHPFCRVPSSPSLSQSPSNHSVLDHSYRPESSSTNLFERDSVQQSQSFRSVPSFPEYLSQTFPESGYCNNSMVLRQDSQNYSQSFFRHPPSSGNLATIHQDRTPSIEQSVTFRPCTPFKTIGQYSQSQFLLSPSASCSQPIDDSSHVVRVLFSDSSEEN